MTEISEEGDLEKIDKFEYSVLSVQWVLSIISMGFGIWIITIPSISEDNDNDQCTYFSEISTLNFSLGIFLLINLLVAASNTLLFLLEKEKVLCLPSSGWILVLCSATLHIILFVIEIILCIVLSVFIWNTCSGSDIILVKQTEIFLIVFWGLFGLSLICLLCSPCCFCLALRWIFDDDD